MNLLFHGNNNSSLYKTLCRLCKKEGWNFLEYQDGSALRGIDIMVADVSDGNFEQTGDLLGEAVHLNIPVYILCRVRDGEKVFPVVVGDGKHLVRFIEYSKRGEKKAVEKIFADLTGSGVRKFNFLVPQSLESYLDWAAEKKGLPRSTFLRSMLEEKAQNDKTYQKYLRTGVKN